MVFSAGQKSSSPFSLPNPESSGVDSSITSPVGNLPFRSVGLLENPGGVAGEGLVHGNKKRDLTCNQCNPGGDETASLGRGG